MRKTLITIIILLILPINIAYAQEFNITSDNVILYNMNDSSILYELDSEKEVNIASLTKIMTTIVAIENIKDLDEKVTVTKEAFNDISEYTQVGLKEGDIVTYKDLLYGIMLPSGADAVNALALQLCGSNEKFVSLMNDKVKELGLKHTHFDNAIGMDSKENYSSAKDVAEILIYSLKNPTFKEIFTARTYKIEAINKNLNSTLIGYSRSYGLDITNIDGAKSGYTDAAGLCLASTSTIDDVEYLLITIHADTNNRSNAIRDSIEIYDYYSSNYGYHKVVNKNQEIKTIKIKWGKKETYRIKAPEDISLYLENTIRKNRIKYKYNGIEEITYKNKLGSKLGTVDVIYEGKTLTTFSVYLDEKLSFYHPVIYGIIIISFILMVTSLGVMRENKKKKNKKKKK